MGLPEERAGESLFHILIPEHNAAAIPS